MSTPTRSGTSRTIAYYHSLVSPWAYIGFAPFLDLVRRHGARIDYRPVALGEVFGQTGGLPLAKRHPARQRYRMMEIKRWRLRRGLDFALWPKHWPFDASPADRVTVALVMQGRDPAPYLMLAHRAVWERQLDLADEGVLATLLMEAGFEPATVLAAARDAAVAEAYAANDERAVADGVFGAPSYVVDGEVFWGQDRLDLLDDMLASGRPAFTGEVSD